MTDFYEIAMGLKKPKTLEDKIKIEKKEDETYMLINFNSVIE